MLFGFGWSRLGAKVWEVVPRTELGLVVLGGSLGSIVPLK